LDTEDILNHDLFKKEGLSHKEIRYMGEASQRLTHRIIESRFFRVPLSKKANISIEDGKWLDINNLKNTAFPKTVLSFLEKSLYF
jgi:hypothetical protein